MSVITFTLNSGSKIPALAWGCGSGKAKTTALTSGKIALDAGFKHIDTAQLYYTEEAVGQIVAPTVCQKMTSLSRPNVRTSYAQYIIHSVGINRPCSVTQSSSAGIQG